MRRPVGDTPGWLATAIDCKVGVHRQRFLPQFQELAATFAHTLRPDGRVGSHHSLQRADRHTVLRPVAGQVRVGSQEVRHHLLSGGFIPLAGVLSPAP